MRKLTIGSLWAEMDDEGNWSSPSPAFARALGKLADHEMAGLSPADGDPLAVAFRNVAEGLGADRVESDVEYGETEEDAQS